MRKVVERIILDISIDEINRITGIHDYNITMGHDFIMVYDGMMVYILTVREVGKCAYLHLEHKFWMIGWITVRIHKIVGGLDSKYGQDTTKYVCVNRDCTIFLPSGNSVRSDPRLNMCRIGGKYYSTYSSFKMRLHAEGSAHIYKIGNDHPLVCQQNHFVSGTETYCLGERDKRINLYKCVLRGGGAEIGDALMEEIETLYRWQSETYSGRLEDVYYGNFVAVQNMPIDEAEISRYIRIPTSCGFSISIDIENPSKVQYIVIPDLHSLSVTDAPFNPVWPDVFKKNFSDDKDSCCIIKNGIKYIPSWYFTINTLFGPGWHTSRMIGADCAILA